MSVDTCGPWNHCRVQALQYNNAHIPVAGLDSGVRVTLRGNNMRVDVAAGLRQIGILMSAHPARDLLRGGARQLAPPCQVPDIRGPSAGCGPDEAST